MTEQVELERAYVVCMDGMGCGTNAHDILVCRPSELDDNLSTMAWEHHDQWFEPDEDDDGCDPECQACAVAHEYTPENMERWDNKRCGGGSFTEDRGVIEVWKALGYSRPKFAGESAFDAWEYIKRWDIPVCQAGASWQEVDKWRGQIVACQDVIRVIGLIGPHTSPRLPPLVLTQLSGALVMAENEIKLLDSNVQKVIARLKAL